MTRKPQENRAEWSESRVPCEAHVSLHGMMIVDRDILYVIGQFGTCPGAGPICARATPTNAANRRRTAARAGRAARRNVMTGSNADETELKRNDARYLYDRIAFPRGFSTRLQHGGKRSSHAARTHSHATCAATQHNLATLAACSWSLLCTVGLLGRMRSPIELFAVPTSVNNLVA
jgi:hypothetical protein